MLRRLVECVNAAPTDAKELKAWEQSLVRLYYIQNIADDKLGDLEACANLLKNQSLTLDQIKYLRYLKKQNYGDILKTQIGCLDPLIDLIIRNIEGIIAAIKSNDAGEYIPVLTDLLPNDENFLKKFTKLLEVLANIFRSSQVALYTQHMQFAVQRNLDKLKNKLQECEITVEAGIKIEAEEKALFRKLGRLDEELLRESSEIDEKKIIESKREATEKTQKKREEILNKEIKLKEYVASKKAFLSGEEKEPALEIKISEEKKAELEKKQRDDEFAEKRRVWAIECFAAAYGYVRPKRTSAPHVLVHILDEECEKLKQQVQTYFAADLAEIKAILSDKHPEMYVNVFNRPAEGKEKSDVDKLLEISSNDAVKKTIKDLKPELAEGIYYYKKADDLQKITRDHTKTDVQKLRDFENEYNRTPAPPSRSFFGKIWAGIKSLFTKLTPEQAQAKRQFEQAQKQHGFFKTKVKEAQELQQRLKLRT